MTDAPILSGSPAGLVIEAKMVLIGEALKLHLNL